MTYYARLRIPVWSQSINQGDRGVTRSWNNRYCSWFVCWDVCLEPFYLWHWSLYLTHTHTHTYTHISANVSTLLQQTLEMLSS